MTLDDYLEKEKMSPSDFARRIGLHRSTICLWRMGVRLPSRDNAIAISDITNGQVTYLDFLEGYRNGGKSRSK